MATKLNSHHRMNKLLPILFCLLILSSCQSPQGKMETAIKDHYTQNGAGHDLTELYEPLTFSKPDSTFTSAETTDAYKALAKKYEAANKFVLDANAGKIKTDPATLEKMTQVRLNCISQAYKMKDTYKGTFNGWKMKHTYRGKNKMTNLVMESSSEAYFDKDYNLRDVYPLESH